jgi:beta-galactosidase/beta-glucuronidase
MLLLVGCSLVLVAGVGWSVARVDRVKQTTVGASLTAARIPSPGTTTRAGLASRAPRNAGTSPKHPATRSVKGPDQGGAVGASTPRPPASIPLTDGWRYLSDPHNLGVAEDWGRGGAAGLAWSPVTIPNDFNPVVSSASDTGTVGWYETQFTGPPITAGRTWRVSFESVRRTAEVWLNGYKIGSSSNPYAPFSLPATTLHPGGSNLLIVRVDNFRGGGSLPEDWWDWGGIMGPISLEPAGRLSLNELGVMPQLGCGYRCGRLLVQGTLTNDSLLALRPYISVRTASPSGAVSTIHHYLPSVPSSGSLPVSFGVPVVGPLALWSPASPSLYSVEVQVVVGHRVELAQTFHVGMRSVQVRGGILYLNGRRLWLHGAAIHEDIAGTGAALSDGDINTIVSELRSVGANITRAHYLLSPRLLDALDSAGIMVWAQPPVDHADGALRTPSGRARALAQLRATLVGERSHPSVVVDSVGNELTPTPDTTPGTRTYLSQAIALARQLDPVVPVGLDTYCYPGFPAQKIYSKLDVIGISSYFGWYPGPTGHSIADFNELAPFLAMSHARYPNQALAISEFGAESLYDGPVTTKGTFEFQSNYLQQTFGVLDQLPYMNGAIYWTLREFAVNPGWTGGVTLPAGTTPDGIHHKGLIAYDGAVKPAFAIAQQAFSQQPRFVH